MKVLIPDSIPLDMSSNNPDIEYVVYSVSQTDFSGVQDAEILVTWMNTAENIAACARQLTSLKLVQTLTAGPDQALSAGFSLDVEIASGIGLHDKPVAEHALALILASIRNFDGLFDSQRSHHWDQRMITAQASPETSPLYTLNGSSVLIVGFGSIASYLAPMITALGAQVSGVAQSDGVRNGYPVIAIDLMAKRVSDADVVISLLPYLQSTENIFDFNFFQSMKKTAVFINIGRGKTVDESSLIRALVQGVIRKAAIDVMQTEPLTIDSPLWDCPNLIITPHISGGRPQESESLIQRNVDAILLHKSITNRVLR